MTRGKLRWGKGLGEIRVLGADSFSLAWGWVYAIFSIDMATIHKLQHLSTLALWQRRRRLLRRLRLPPHLIRASVVARLTTCGKANCRCRRGDKHGPFYYLTQCLAVGQIRKFLLKTAADQQNARAAVAAFSRYYDCLEALSQINTELLRRGERLLGK